MNKSCLASAKQELFIVYRTSFIKYLRAAHPLYRPFPTMPNSEEILYIGVVKGVIHKMLCLVEPCGQAVHNLFCVCQIDKSPKKWYDVFVIKT